MTENMKVSQESKKNERKNNGKRELGDYLRVKTLRPTLVISDTKK